MFLKKKDRVVMAIVTDRETHPLEVIIYIYIYIYIYI